MASFLTLCQRLTMRSGVIGTAPSSVTGQTGRQAKCVDWIQQAWSIIQNLKDGQWSFLQGEFSSSLTPNISTYTANSLGILTRFGEWKGDRMVEGQLYRPFTIYDPDSGVSDEGELEEISYAAWRERYDRGSQTANKPVHYAIAPDQSLRFGPVPDKAYIVRGEYKKAPQELAANGEEPDMPSRFHDIIVDRAVILISESDEAPAALTGAMRAFNEKFGDMCNALLPDFSTVLGR